MTISAWIILGWPLIFAGVMMGVLSVPAMMGNLSRVGEEEGATEDFAVCFFPWAGRRIHRRARSMGIHRRRRVTEPPIHIADTHADNNGKAWCGAWVADEFHFVSIDHAAINARNGGYLTPCPDCLAAIQAAFAGGAG